MMQRVTHMGITAIAGAAQDPATQQWCAVVHFWATQTPPDSSTKESDPNAKPEFFWTDSVRFPRDKENRARRRILKHVKPRLRQMCEDLKRQIEHEKAKVNRHHLNSLGTRRDRSVDADRAEYFRFMTAAKELVEEYKRENRVDFEKNYPELHEDVTKAPKVDPQTMSEEQVQERLTYIRSELQNQRSSKEDLTELYTLRAHIDPKDKLLLGFVQFGQTAEALAPIMKTERELINERLEYLRSQLEAECISLGELQELESLSAHIDPSDVRLLEAAGVKENPDEDC